MSDAAPLTFLCVMAATHGLYAESFLAEVKRQGHRLLVLTRSEALGYDWPREVIDGLYAVNDIFNPLELRHSVSYLAREERIDRLVGLGEYDIELAADLREHLRLAGLSQSTARYFRDKLAMRERASEANLSVPEFIGAIHFPAIAQFLSTVPGPWVLKPRMEASSKGIQVLTHPEAVWRELHGLGDAVSHYLLERYVPGDVFHVDSVVTGGKVHFAAVHRYGKPILELHREGGVYTTCRVPAGSSEERALLAFNEQVMAALGLMNGVTHIEYIQGRTDGQFYFLEASARVGAGNIEAMVEAESGLNLWAEWARLEAVGATYIPKPSRDAYAGVLACAVASSRVDASGYLAPGVEEIPAKPYHMSLLVQGDDYEKVLSQLTTLAGRVGQELMVRL
jgi:biotin carboxylase